MYISKKTAQLTFTGVVMLGLTACSTTDTSTSQAKELTQEESQTDVVDYTCAGEPLTVLFHGEEAQITWKDKSYILTQAVSASGAHYLGEHISFWIKGKEAGLEVNDLEKVQCKVVRIES